MVQVVLRLGATSALGPSRRDKRWGKRPCAAWHVAVDDLAIQGVDEPMAEYFAPPTEADAH
jgi:hypothetical protein